MSGDAGRRFPVDADASRPREHVVRRVGLGEEGTFGGAWACLVAAGRCRALHDRHAIENAGPLMLRDLELEPGDVADRRSRRLGDHLADDQAAVRHLPRRAGEVPSDRLAVADEGRDRLPEAPGEATAAIDLALVDLGADGMDRLDNGPGRGSDRRLAVIGARWRGRHSQYGQGHGGPERTRDAPRSASMAGHLSSSFCKNALRAPAATA